MNNSVTHKYQATECFVLEAASQNSKYQPMKLIEKYAYKKLEHKFNDVHRRVFLPPLETVIKVGVIWKPEYQDAYNFLHEYFVHSQVIFRNLCIFEDEEPKQYSSNTITKKDLNWLGLPKSGIIDSFIQTDFDLLFNVALEQNLVLDYVTALSRAKFKIGWSEKTDHFFDLNINISANPDALYLAKQQIFYIGQLNKNSK